MPNIITMRDKDYDKFPYFRRMYDRKNTRKTPEKVFKRSPME